MNGVDYIRSAVTERGLICDVQEQSDGGAYDNGDYTTVDTVTVAIFDPSSTFSVVSEGGDDDVSLVGLVVPDTNADGNRVEHVGVNQRLVPQNATGQQYRVETKDGHPNDVDPDVWRLGLAKANQSD